jgi:hypothetical protein
MLLFGPTPFKTMLILEQHCLGVKVLAWYIDPNGVKNKYAIKIPILYYACVG